MTEDNTHGLSVALMGRAGAGKDTVASILTEHRGYARVAFADPLKEMALAVDPIIGRVGQSDCRTVVARSAGMAPRGITPRSVDSFRGSAPRASGT